MNSKEFYNISSAKEFFQTALEPVIKIAGQLQLIRSEFHNEIETSIGSLKKSPVFTQSIQSVDSSSRDGIEILALLRFLEKLSLDSNAFQESWFPRLIGELLLKLPFGFPNMPLEQIKEIWNLIEQLKKRYPTFHEKVLSHFLTYDYEGTNFPYQKKHLSLSQFMENNIIDDNINFENEIAGKKVAIIIPFFVSNDEKFIGRLQIFEENITRINAQSHRNLEVCIMLNNCNWDESSIQNFLLKHSLNKVVISKENVGAAKARNEWVRTLMKDHGDQTSFFLFLDDDSYLSDPRCIAKMAYYLEKNPKFGGITPQIVYKHPSNRKILDEGYESPWIFSALSDFNVFNKEKMQTGDVWKEAFLLEGSCLMFSRDTLSCSELFPEEYNYYHEESQLELMIKQNQARMNVVLCTSYATHHKIGGGSISPHAIYYVYRNFIYLLEDIGIQKKNPQVYKIIMEYFSAYCQKLVESESGERGLHLAKRFKLAQENIAGYRSPLRLRFDEDFNANAETRIIERRN